MPDSQHPRLPFGLSASAVAVVIAVIVQTALLFIWGGQLDQRVSHLEGTVRPLVDGTLARLDERTAAMKHSLERLERRAE
ncbi:MAG: hypothetical protein ACK4E3_03640 [Brevundimonas sp.]|uniref:hypothetical protein n=1 Tax=Brevundimonas sp. TaxID=1871086 RepID=UPI00391CDF51